MKKMKTSKRVLAVLLTLLLVVSALPLGGLTAFAATSRGGAFEYEVLSKTDKTCEITDYTGSAAVLDIPAQFDGYTVTSIGYHAFENCANLTQVNIPSSVTSICDYAFSYCTSLTEVTIPNSVMSIGDYAFSYTILTKVSIPNSVTSIGNSAFENCRSLTEVTIPNSVTSIGVRAFYCCTSLTEVTIPNSVTSIGDYAFRSCSLTEVTIPNSVTSIGNGAFEACYSLTEVTIPNSVTSIGDSAFSSCYSLTEVIIPNSVTSIGVCAFYYCPSLTKVTIPNSVTSIGDHAFRGCSLTQVTIPNSVMTIGDGAFEACTNLTEVIIPQSVTSIGRDAFSLCDDNLTIYGYSDSYAESYAKENGYDFVVIRDFEDVDSGVSMVVTEVDAIPENAELAVSVIDTANDRITYDISIQAGGKKIQPNGSVTVKIPVPETMDGANVKVYCQKSDGTLTDMHAIFQDGYAVFTTDHFSIYVLTSDDLNTPDVLLGDINGDGEVDAIDARWVLQASTNSRELTAEQEAAADVNADSVIDAIDARWILQASTGSRTI